MLLHCTIIYRKVKLMNTPYKKYLITSAMITYTSVNTKMPLAVLSFRWLIKMVNTNALAMSEKLITELNNER